MLESSRGTWGLYGAVVATQERYTQGSTATGASAIAYYGALCNLPRKQVSVRLDELIELVGLKGREKSPVHTYSKGMQQRLGLAIAMISDHELLILDEPASGLDQIARPSTLVGK